MSIGERIHFFRTMRGMTQKFVGMRLGFSERSADVRVAQYESDARTPKRELLENIAGVLGVDPLALTVPDIDSLFGVMHTFFALEDRYDLRAEYDGSKGIIKIVPGYNYIISEDLAELVDSWAKQAEKYRAGEITKEEYNNWRYTFPSSDPTASSLIVSPEELCDMSSGQLKKDS
jgi:transcriptional regulator with XRE-family HTH domain